MENSRFLSIHNLSVFENLLDDMQKELLKFKLVYQHIGNYGFTSDSDGLLGECVHFMGQYVSDLSVLFDCLSSGHDMNREDGDE